MSKKYPAAWHLFCFVGNMFSRIEKLPFIGAGILSVCMLSCNQVDHPADVVVDKTIDSIIKPVFIPATDTIYAGAGDTTIQLKSGGIFINGHIMANKNQPKYTLSARKGQTVTAILKPLKKGGNVRINQIQQPGGAFDGPFSDSLSYIFKRNGKIRFIIGENLMEGDPYTGDFILHVTLSEQ